MSKAKITIEVKDDNSVKLETKGDVDTMLNGLVTILMEDEKFNALVSTAYSCVMQIKQAQTPPVKKIIIAHK